MFQEKGKISSSTGIKPKFFRHQACSQVTILCQCTSQIRYDGGNNLNEVLKFWGTVTSRTDADGNVTSVSQMKHQLDATLCRFYFCRVTLHVSGASAHHQEYLKLVRRPLVHVLSLQVSHHISLLGPERP